MFRSKHEENQKNMSFTDAQAVATCEYLTLHGERDFADVTWFEREESFSGKELLKAEEKLL